MVGRLYRYNGSTAPIDLSQANYRQTGAWTDLGAFTPTHDTSLTILPDHQADGADRRRSIKIVTAYDPTKGVAGDIYRYVGADATVGLVHTDYTDTSLWQLVYDMSRIEKKLQTLATGAEVAIAAGYDPAKGAVGATYMFIGAIPAQFDLANTDYTDATKWREVPTPKFDTTADASNGDTKNKIEPILTGDEVQVAKDYDSSKGAIGHVYRYVGSNALLDLAQTNYLDTTKWADVGPLEPKFDTALAAGATTKQTALTAGDQVRIADGYDPAKGVPGSVYLYVGSALTRDLANTDYTNTSLWREIDGVGQVQAYVLNSSVDATGALAATATSNQTIHAFVEAAAAALGVGGGAGLAASGAGASAVNTISVATRAYIDGEFGARQHDNGRQHLAFGPGHVGDHGGRGGGHRLGLVRGLRRHIGGDRRLARPEHDRRRGCGLYQGCARAHHQRRIGRGVRHQRCHHQGAVGGGCGRSGRRGHRRHRGRGRRR